jgi:hypothetical protein
MKNRFGLYTLALLFVSAMISAAQEYPKIEVPVGFSFVNLHPDLTPITSFNIFGGGGGLVYNVTPILGIKADFMGYTQGSGLRQRLINNGYTVGQLSGNVFTYMFGPQFKKHGGKLQPFGEALFGAAHSNAYAQIYNVIHGGVTTMLLLWNSAGTGFCANQTHSGAACGGRLSLHTLWHKRDELYGSTEQLQVLRRSQLHLRRAVRPKFPWIFASRQCSLSTDRGSTTRRAKELEAG